MGLSQVKAWHERTRPEPGDKDFQVQLGCHFEEIVEMLECLEGDNGMSRLMISSVAYELGKLSRALKIGTVRVSIQDRARMLDSICDQIVTGVGVGHCAKMNVVEGLRRVDASNWSKFDANGQPIRDANGKIVKGPNYKEPNLGDLV